MFFISHRGNLNGKILERENSPEYIKEAQGEGFDVEVDVWCFRKRHVNRWWVGHDEPQYEVTKEWLIGNKATLWYHAKNIEAANELLKLDVHFFFHQEDDITLTSKNYLWTYPGKRPLLENSIAVMPEDTDWTGDEIGKCAGICSDYILQLEVIHG